MSSATGVDARVYIDGTRLADSAADYAGDPTAPLALAGLKVTWGRSTTVDQPEPSSCEFSVLDHPGGSSFTELLSVGRRIDVDATGWVYPDPSVSTFIDPSFEAGTAPPARTSTSGTVARSTLAAHTGAASVLIEPNASTHELAGASVVGLLPPGPLQVPPNAPDAWDAIPRTTTGQSWRAGVSIAAPPLVEVTVAAVAMSGPYPSSVGASLGAVASVWHPDPREPTRPWVTAPPVTLKPAGGAWVALRATVRNLNTWAAQAPETTWDAQPSGWAWADYGRVFIDDAQVLAPSAGTAQVARVFSGRVTDLEAGWDGALSSPVVSVTATDVAAELANINVGDAPWPVQPMSTRFARVVALAGMAGLTYEIPSSLGAVPLSYQDVDSQAAAGLLADFVQSVDGVMWVTTHAVTGPFIRVENTAERPPLSMLALVGGVIVIVDSGAVEGAAEVSACLLPRDAVRFGQSVSDVNTRVAVSWLEQGTDSGKVTTTDRTETVTDASLESGGYGVRRLSLSTLLQAQGDAQRIAAAILGRTSVTGWRATGLRILDGTTLTDSSPDAVALMVALLSGTARLGLPLRITDLPAWAPQGGSGVFLEGGEYTFTDGAWQLDLTVSRAANQGNSLPWSDLDPVWLWNQIDPTIRWEDLAGVAGP